MASPEKPAAAWTAIIFLKETIAAYYEILEWKCKIFS